MDPPNEDNSASEDLIDFVEGYQCRGRQPPYHHAGYTYVYERNSNANVGWQSYRCIMRDPYCKGRISVSSMRIMRENGEVVKRGRFVCAEHNHPPKTMASPFGADHPATPSDLDWLGAGSYETPQLASGSSSGSVTNTAQIKEEKFVVDTATLTCVLCNATFPKAKLLTHIAEELDNYRYRCGQCDFKCLDYYTMLQHQLDFASHKCEEKTNSGKEWLTQLLYNASLHGKKHGMEEVYRLELSAPKHKRSMPGEGEESAPSAKRVPHFPVDFPIELKPNEVLLPDSRQNSNERVRSRDDRTCRLCGEIGKHTSTAQRDHVAVAHGEDLPNCACPVSGCRWKGAKCKNTITKHLQRTHGLVNNNMARILECFPNYTEGRNRLERREISPSTSTSTQLGYCPPTSMAISHNEAIERLVMEASSSTMNQQQQQKQNSSASSPSLVGHLDWQLDSLVATIHQPGGSSQGQEGEVKIEQTDFDTAAGHLFSD